ncbi:AMP-binding protein [Ramlibacter sp.]|uniref:AMP-binding protein n=1 Tax=Ramlibacter sp. TaxID=1917967 RepID=UPI002D8082AA|nr:AMP-binding protein [Ramlibacter sp.]
MLAATASQVPDAMAFEADGRVLTVAQLRDQSDRLGAALLKIGLRTGDRAMFQMGTAIETVLALLACYRVGVIPVCAVPQHREVEIGQLSRLAEPAAYFVQADFSGFDLVGFARRMMDQHSSYRHLIVARGGGGGDGWSMGDMLEGMTAREAQEILRDVRLGCGDVLSFQLSGGTTGIPKIIPRFHGEYLAHSATLTNIHGIDGTSRMIWALPLIHNAGQLYSIMPAVWGGIGTVLMSKVDIPRMLDLIESHRVTHALSIGPVAPKLLAYEDVAKHDLSSLKLFATMSRADKLERHIGVPCGNLFGITEGLLLGTPGDAPQAARHGTQGKTGCNFTEIRLLQPDSEVPAAPGTMGELCFRGPSSLRGYFRGDPAAFTSEGFVRTGDMMTAHVIEGVAYYAFEGRSRDNVNRGGEKIGCEEVEAFASRHAAIADAKLVAMPDEFYGEKGCLFVVPRPGAKAPSVNELAEFLASEGLARYKCPERIEVIDEFPVTRIGKIDKPALKRKIAELLAKEAAHRAG